MAREQINESSTGLPRTTIVRRLIFLSKLVLVDLFMNIQKYTVTLLTFTDGFVGESKVNVTSVVIAFAGTNNST